MVSARFWTATTTWSMRAATVSRPERLLSVPPICRVRRPAGLRHLDAMRLRQQGADELLREVGIHAIDRPLAPGGHHLADPGGLDDRRVAVLLEAGHFLAHGEPFGDDADQLVVEFVDASPER